MVGLVLVSLFYERPPWVALARTQNMSWPPTRRGSHAARWERASRGKRLALCRGPVSRIDANRKPYPRGAGRVKRLCGAGLFAAMLASSAQAGSFDDFNLGVAARNRGHDDAAIAAFSRALAAGDLAPNLQYIALFDRGVSYALKMRYVEAIADFSTVIKLRPDYFEAYLGRAQIYNATGQIAFGAADCGTMISLKPDAHSPYALCGRIQFELGQYGQAVSFFENALRLGEGRTAYNLLWLDLARMRAGQSDTGGIAQTARSVDVDRWPSPILNFFSGTGTPEAVDAAAAEGDAQTQRDQKCELGFYLGEWHLGHNDIAAARPLLVQALSLCPNNFIELEPAKVEMKRLNRG